MGYEPHFDNSGIVVKNCVRAVVTPTDFFAAIYWYPRGEREQYNQRDGHYVRRLGLGSAPTLNLVHLNWNANWIVSPEEGCVAVGRALFSGCNQRCSTG